MWVATVNGFYSVIAFDPVRGKADLDKIPSSPEDTLIVRCRAQEDMEYLAEHFGDLKWWRDNAADYMFRAFLTRQQWAGFMVAQTAELDYSNFKNEVTARQGKARHDVYMRVWSALMALQPTRSRWVTRPFAGRFTSSSPRLPLEYVARPLPEPPDEDTWATSDEEFLRWMEEEDCRPRRLSEMTDEEFTAYEGGS